MEVMTQKSANFRNQLQQVIIIQDLFKNMMLVVNLIFFHCAWLSSKSFPPFLLHKTSLRAAKEMKYQLMNKEHQNNEDQSVF